MAQLAAPVARLPALAVRTHFSAGEGSASPEAWGNALTAVAPDDSAGRMLLADRDDLCALPAMLDALGRERVVPGATVRLGSGPQHDAILFPHAEAGYSRLCRFLTRRHAEPELVDAWAAGMSSQRPDLSGLTALGSDDATGRIVAEAGAVVFHHRYLSQAPASSLFPSFYLPVVCHTDPDGRRGDPIRRALARKQGRPLADRPQTLAEAMGIIAAMRQAGETDALDQARAYLDQCPPMPAHRWWMPPSLHADPDRELRRRAEAGVRRRYGRMTAEVRQRLDHELSVIAAKGFSGYILTVADLAAGRRTCGRGSGASSLVVYALGITDVDPIRYRLLFDRFLNQARVDPPDLDVDFPWDERDAVIAAAIRTYGNDHVAMVATHQVLRRWGALRAAARAFGRGTEETSAARDALMRESRYGMAADLGGEWQCVVDGAQILEGSPWHMGLHCGGLVITQPPIHDLAPIHPAAKCIPIDGAKPTPVPALAWEKDGAETLGFVKIDILGNRALAVIRDCLADLAQDGIAIDEARWRPAEDPATRRLVAAGDTMGCFYIESPAMRQLQAKAGSGDFDRLVVHSSIIRPAANRWIAEYLRRLHHVRRTKQHDPAWYPHPALHELLSESYGILSYQEDIMLAAMRLAGFDEREANALRKALGQWDTQDRLRAFATRFRTGCQERGIADPVIDQVWSNIASFAGYSFCKAHSASYAMVSFQCAYLKTHYPAHFLARVVANEGGFYGAGAYLEDARRRDITILGPCVMESDWLTRRHDASSIRCGLHLVPHLGQAQAQRLIAARQQQPFTGVVDLRRRTGLSPTALGILARAGALDAIRPDLNRSQVCWLAESAGLHPARFREENDDGVIFRTLVPADRSDPEPPPLAAPTSRRAAWERYRALGFLPEGHPIWFCPPVPGTIRCRDLHPRMAGRIVCMLVWPITRKQVEAKPKNGDPSMPMAFVTLEDHTGLVETVWFPQPYREHGALLDANGPLLIQGRVDAEWGVVSVQVTQAEAVRPQPDA